MFDAHVKLLYKPGYVPMVSIIQILDTRVACLEAGTAQRSACVMLHRGAQGTMFEQGAPSCSPAASLAAAG